MQEYLEAGGFVKQQIYNYKNSFYLCNRLDANNYVVYVKGNAIKHYMKKVYNTIMKYCPDEMFILTYADRAIIKIIDNISKYGKFKNMPYNKCAYAFQLQNIPNVCLEYAIKVHNDSKLLQAHDIGIMHAHSITVLYDYDDYDNWLDKNEYII